MKCTCQLFRFIQSACTVCARYRLLAARVPAADNDAASCDAVAQAKAVAQCPFPFHDIAAAPIAQRYAANRARAITTAACAAACALADGAATGGGDGGGAAETAVVTGSDDVASVSGALPDVLAAAVTATPVTPLSPAL